MLATRYLRGVPVTRFGGAPGVFVAPHERMPGGFRYLSSHEDGSTSKARIFGLLARQGRPEPPDEWEFRHVVAPAHLSDVDFRGEFAAHHGDELPCALLHEPERRAIDRALHCDAPATSPDARALAQRARQAIAAHADPRRHSVLRARVRELATRYRDAYEGDRVLQRVAQNVFDEALALLR